MRATGIVRRIDELGRVVIPKEIRRTLRIREGDPLLTTGNKMDVPAIFGIFTSVMKATGFISENKRGRTASYRQKCRLFSLSGLAYPLENVL